MNGKSLSSELKEIITGAKRLYANYGKDLLSDLGFMKVLDDYEKAIEDTARAMTSLSIWKMCAICGNSPKGSCCAPEVAIWYDAELVFVNLLMGCDVEKGQFYKDHCFFLGKNGCILKARHYYCVHYLCPEIKAILSAAELDMLYRTIGREILTGSNVLHYFEQWRKHHDGVIMA